MKKLILLITVLSLVLVAGCAQSPPPIHYSGNSMDDTSIAKFHYNETIVAPAINTWFNIPWNMMIANESTTGFYYNQTNNNFIIINTTGIIRVQGCVHPYNNNIGNQEATLWLRVLVNGDEKRCLQSSRTKAFQSSGVDILPFAGTIYAEAGDVLELQWRTDNTNIDLRSDMVFDKAVAASINFELMD